MAEDLKHCEVCGRSEVELPIRRYVIGVKKFDTAGGLQAIGDVVETWQCSECWVASLCCIGDSCRGLNDPHDVNLEKPKPGSGWAYSGM